MTTRYKQLSLAADGDTYAYGLTEVLRLCVGSYLPHACELVESLRDEDVLAAILRLYDDSRLIGDRVAAS